MHSWEVLELTDMHLSSHACVPGLSNNKDMYVKQSLFLVKDHVIDASS